MKRGDRIKFIESNDQDEMTQKINEFVESIEDDNIIMKIDYRTIGLSDTGWFTVMITYRPRKESIRVSAQKILQTHHELLKRLKD